MQYLRRCFQTELKFHLSSPRNLLKQAIFHWSTRYNSNFD